MSKSAIKGVDSSIALFERNPDPTSLLDTTYLFNRFFTLKII